MATTENIFPVLKPDFPLKLINPVLKPKLLNISRNRIPEK